VTLGPDGKALVRLGRVSWMAVCEWARDDEVYAAEKFSILLAALEERGGGRASRLGLHGGTLDRVREARGLIERGEKKTRACRRAGIDPRTYDRYAPLEEVVIGD
jgi:hypothetical protein